MNMECINVHEWLIESHRFSHNKDSFWIHKIPTKHNWLLSNFKNNITNYDLGTDDFEKAYKKSWMILDSLDINYSSAISFITNFMSNKNKTISPKFSKKVIKFADELKKL